METKKETLSPTDRFWRLLKPDQKEIRNVYLYAILNGLIMLSIPLGIQAIVNLIQGGRVSSSWVVLVVFVVLGVLFGGLLQIFQLRVVENIQQRIFTRAAFEFTYRLPRIKMEELYRHYAPELMNRFFDTMSVQKGLSKVLMDFSAATLQVVFGLILLSLYHPFFILFSLLLVLLIYVIFRFTAKPGLNASLKESKYKYNLAHWLEELARTAATFKLAGDSSLPMSKTNDHVDSYLDSREKHFKELLKQFSFLVGFKVIIATGLLAIGGVLVMEQLMNIGQFVAAEIIILMIMSSVEKLVNSLETIYDILTALEKIGEVTDLELEPEDTNRQVLESNGKGLSIELDQAVFAYPGARSNSLKDISLRIEANDRLVITGENGSGKTTLLQLLSGIYDLTSGSISFDDLSKGNLHQEQLRSMIGDLLSHEQLFEGTVMENLAMGRKGATFESVQEAVEAAQLKGFISKLPDGYNTRLDPQGRKLPRSLVQKLLIARSIADKPRLLLLEDSFEYIDMKQRQQIIDYLFAPERPWTLVAVSADPYLIEKATSLYTMINGQIKRIGGNKTDNN